jgi:4-carboxymuconolactone decarboxylase
MDDSTISTTQPFEKLTPRQGAIAPVAALAAAGEVAKLGKALNVALDAGVGIAEIKEVLVQVYAYAGFPRSLNALGQFMKVVEKRRQQGINDAPGQSPQRPIPAGAALLAAGLANQTKLSGGPVKGPLFGFAPAIDEYLKTHLFGDIFERDNLDWASREVATVSMLSALPGVESQLQSHVRIAMNVGLTEPQLMELAGILRDRADPAFGQRAREALDRQLAADGRKK